MKGEGVESLDAIIYFCLAGSIFPGSASGRGESVRKIQTEIGTGGIFPLPPPKQNPMRKRQAMELTEF